MVLYIFFFRLAVGDVNEGSLCKLRLQPYPEACLDPGPGGNKQDRDGEYGVRIHMRRSLMHQGSLIRRICSSWGL